MKKVYLLFALGTTFFLSNAQTNESDSWKISWNKKVILVASKSDERSNSRNIKRSELYKNFTLEITYKEGDVKTQKEWNRSFILFDDADNEITRKDSTHNWKFKGTELAKFLGDKNILKIYTMAIPTDPGLAARVRVRRVHLCTLEFQ